MLVVLQSRGKLMGVFLGLALEGCCIAQVNVDEAGIVSRDLPRASTGHVQQEEEKSRINLLDRVRNGGPPSDPPVSFHSLRLDWRANTRSLSCLFEQLHSFCQ